MSTTTFIGIKDMIRQPDRREWAVGTGDLTIRTYIGPQSQAAALKTQLVADGATKVTQADDGATSTVTATYPFIAEDGVPPTTNAGQNITWELLGNDLNKDLRTHSSLSPTTDAEAKDINAAIEAVSAGTAKVSSWCAKAGIVFDLYSKGTTEYVLTQFVLRKTIKVSAADGVAASLANCNKVEAPTGVPTALFAIPTNQGDGAIEWLKKPPTVAYLGNGKYSIAQEWWAGKWSQDLYGGTASP